MHTATTLLTFQGGDIVKTTRDTAFRFLLPSFFLLLGALLIPAAANAQINFPKSSYYLAIGDSISAGEGAMPVTQGAIYRLYDQGVFGAKQDLDFSNIAIRAARTYEVLNYQVPEAICLTGFQPSVVTITVGANDFLREIEQGHFPPDVAAIATRSAEIVNRLLNGANYVDPQTGQARLCPGLPDVTVLITNNYTLPHPDPTISAFLNLAASGYAQYLQGILSSTVPVPAGSHVGIADLYTAFKDRNGLLLIQKKNGFTGPGPFDFEVHPTNAGHVVIAQAFQRAWAALQ